MVRAGGFNLEPVIRNPYGGERDWADIESVLLRQRRVLDWVIVDDQPNVLLEMRGGDAVRNRLAALRAGGA